ncbi:TcaA 3rd/4th domain-containing protein [Sporolactobacillus vineae]|uniref:TcaA 3rd/4th domain-containing protein n=1 Tax=Sporolactobacillus vineae TaxID=444463 RepID=UPI0002894EA5|nr:hypothetical protein [Sporolactobacillus vineae]
MPADVRTSGRTEEANPVEKNPVSGSEPGGNREREGNEGHTEDEAYIPGIPSEYVSPAAPAPAEDGTEAANRSTAMSGKQPFYRKKRYMIPLVIVLVLLVAAYFSGKYMTSPVRTVDAFEQAVRDQNTGVLKSLILPSEHTHVNDAQIKAMLALFKSHPGIYSQVVSDLAASAHHPDRTALSHALYYLQKDGKKYLVFDNYKIGTTPIQAKILTNLKGMSVGIKGVGRAQTAAQADDQSPQSLTVGPVIPGEYGFYGDSDKLSTAKTADLTRSGKTIDFSGVYLTIQSNLNGAELYVDNKDTGETVSAAKTYGPFKKSETPVFYAKYTVGGKSIKTNSVTIVRDSAMDSGDGNRITLSEAESSGIDLEFDNVDPSSDFYALDGNDEQSNSQNLNGYFQGFYDALSSAVSDDMPDDFKTYFVNGSSYQKAQLQSAKKFYDQGITESIQDFTVDHVKKIGDGLYAATTDESWSESITDPDTGDSKDKDFSYTNTYQLQETAPGELKIVGQKISHRQDSDASSDSSY